MENITVGGHTCTGRFDWILTNGTLRKVASNILREAILFRRVGDLLAVWKMQNHKLGEAREELCLIKCIGCPKQVAEFFPVLQDLAFDLVVHRSHAIISVHHHG